MRRPVGGALETLLHKRRRALGRAKSPTPGAVLAWELSGVRAPGTVPLAKLSLWEEQLSCWDLGMGRAGTG